MFEVGEYVLNKRKEVCHTSVKEADKLILEYMRVRGLTIDDLRGNVIIQKEENNSLNFNIKTTYWYKGELILSVTHNLKVTEPSKGFATISIDKGNW